ncbi:MAG TPA: hypothetical protein VMV82_06085 [Candidatus Dormibacteraeota bacterium]|nr:hypothetical protein [Candidatus Dormibacteraeota bacterium]
MRVRDACAMMAYLFLQRLLAGAGSSVVVLRLFQYSGLGYMALTKSRSLRAALVARGF